MAPERAISHEVVLSLVEAAHLPTTRTHLSGLRGASSHRASDASGGWKSGPAAESSTQTRAVQCRSRAFLLKSPENLVPAEDELRSWLEQGTEYSQVRSPTGRVSGPTNATTSRWKPAAVHGDQVVRRESAAQAHTSLEAQERRKIVLL